MTNNHLYINVLVEKDYSQFWILMPCNEEQLAEKIGKIGEYRIVNYESSIKCLNLDDKTDLILLNDLFSEMLFLMSNSEMSKHNSDVVAVLEASIYLHNSVNPLLNDYEVADSLDNFIFKYTMNSNVFFNCYDMSDIAKDKLNSLYDYGKEIEKYFDFDAYGKELSYNDTYVFLDEGVCVCFYD